MFLGVPKSIVVRLGWMTMSYGSVQLLRLLNNVILARILAPPIFGLMALVNAIRTGVELLSDVGIMQNIISSPRAEDPLFYDTAWTLQALRGLVLAALSMLLAVPIARFFNYPQLAVILPVASLFFVFTGFDSTARPLVQKQLQVARISVFDIGIGVISLVAHVSIALITPTVWALVLGSVVTGAATLIASFLFIPGLRHRFIVHLLYDARYSEAGWILPVLCVGVWFGILTSINDSILMGLARPAYPALSNAAKLITYLIGVPLAFYFYGFVAAVAVISAGEVVKYAALWLLSHKEHLRFGRDDFALTIAFVVTAVVVGEITRILGVGGGVQSIVPHLIAGTGRL